MARPAEGTPVPDSFDPSLAAAGNITGVVDHDGREHPMQERSFSKAPRPAAAVDPPDPPPTETPIYDAVARLWLQHGREVPHAPAPRPEVQDDDLFHRA